VKNVSSQAAQVVRKLKARHRLCLTARRWKIIWASCGRSSISVAGVAGDTKAFTKTWRTPIEKNGNKLRRDLFGQTRQTVHPAQTQGGCGQELPDQDIDRAHPSSWRVRNAIFTKRCASRWISAFREEIADKGFARSHIIILDGAAQIAQVCCDPRLLKLNPASRVKERAKSTVDGNAARMVQRGTAHSGVSAIYLDARMIEEEWHGKTGLW